jgi:hypothetical protein
MAVKRFAVAMSLLCLAVLFTSAFSAVAVAADEVTAEEIDSLSVSGPCKYCSYCRFCAECHQCPCDANEEPNCAMCKYCSYCKLCRFCGAYCQPGGWVDSLAGYGEQIAATLGFSPKQEDIDSLADDLKKVDWEAANKNLDEKFVPEDTEGKDEL